MTRIIKYYLLGLTLFFCHNITFAQQTNSSTTLKITKTDSLLTLLKKDKPDTNKVIHLYLLTKESQLSGEYEKGLSYGNEAIELARKLNFKKGIATATSNIGNIYLQQADYSKALDYFLKALKIEEELNNKKGMAVNNVRIGIVYWNQSDYSKTLEYYLIGLKNYEELKDKNGIALTLGNIGNVYYNQADYPKALDYYFKALKVNEKVLNSALLLGDDGRGTKNGIAINLGNIGNVYRNQSDFPKTLYYYFRSLKIFEELGNKNSAVSIIGNIGIVYMEQADYPKALDYYFKALKMDEELGNKNGIARNLGNIGIVYHEQGNSQKSKVKKDSLFNKGLDYYLKALKIYEERGDKNSVAAILGSIGSLYTETGKFTESERYLLNGLKLAKEIGAQNSERKFEEMLTTLYSKTNRFQTALEHYKKAMALKDTLFSEEKNNEITRKEMNYEFEKKEAAAKAEQDKKDTIAVEEKQRQKIITYSVSGGLFLVLLLAIFIFRGYRQKQKANIIITQQKSEVEKQKHIIEEKNKDITDSINYAKRIQHAKLPKKEEIYISLPQSFVLFKPKDIVSGDFYFFHKNKQSVYIAAADCTGHGVPGAFMSLIGLEKLDDAVSQSTNTSEILKLLNKGIKTSLRQSDSHESTRDGMDIALCSIDTQNFIVNYAGANRPIWIIRSEQTEVEEIKATKTAIGGLTEDDQHFETHQIKLKQGDTFYICTDGYADQFSGQNGKKLMTRKFKEILVGIQNKTMQNQETYLDNFIENWKAETEQIDDILVIGVRL